MSRAAAAVLAAVFAWSGVAKLVRRPDLTRLGLPAWSAPATAIVEIALAGALALSPAWGGVGALVLLAGFTTFLARRLNTGTGCGCFGSTSTRPVSATDLVRNGALLLLAGIAAFA